MRLLALAALLPIAGCTGSLEKRIAPPAPAISPVTEAELRALMTPLASDGFEGRMPGTAGEDRTIAYLATQLHGAGVAPGMSDGTYIQRFAIDLGGRKRLVDDPGPPSGQAGFTEAMQAAKNLSSRNVIGVVRGRNPDGKAVVMMAHWDHLGICRPKDPDDRICNGASDNASGVAAILAVASRVSQMRLDRDVWFVFTGAEEWGLLGAKAFAANPPVPLADIVAGFNQDTVAIAPAGTPVALLAVKGSPLETLVRETAAAMGRRWDGDRDADVMLHFQDGWALAEKGVPFVLAGSGISDFAALEAYLQSDYHGVDDEMSETLELGGATADANLHVALVKRAASRQFQPRR